MKTNKQRFKKNQLVVPVCFIAGYPMGIKEGTWCRIKEVRKDKILVICDDTRLGQYWIHPSNLRVL